MKYEAVSYECYRSGSGWKIGPRPRGKVMRMLGNRVLVKRELESETKGLIVIPHKYRSKPQEGEVIGVGPDVTTIRVGDRVLFGKWAVLEVQPYGCIIREPDIMGVIG